MTTTVEKIGPERKFYGYIIGVSLERAGDSPAADVPGRMFARFEYGGSTTVYEVPDFALFSNLAQRMLDNAQMRIEHEDYGYQKLWIEKTAEGWEVDVP